ncbi:MAG: dihydroxyacetone kinase-like protein [Methylophilaceae bacterium]
MHGEEKCVDSFAETGADLATCKALGDKINAQTASIGVAFTSCTLLPAGKLTFEISETEVEMSVGIHGEPGRKCETMHETDAIIKDMVDTILTDLADKAKSAEVLLLVNGLGATPLMELYLIY